MFGRATIRLGIGPHSIIFQPITLESLGPINNSAVILGVLGRRIADTLAEVREVSF